MVSTLTHRQFLTLEAWIRSQWNKPNRTDHYIMQLTASLRSIASQQAVNLEDCKIQWDVGGQPDAAPQHENINNPDYRSPAQLRTMHALGVNW